MSVFVSDAIVSWWIVVPEILGWCFGARRKLSCLFTDSVYLRKGESVGNNLEKSCKR